MRIAVYGGSFNPPHLGHLEAAEAVSRTLRPDLFLIIPDNIPPHKSLADASPTAEQRFEMCMSQFSKIENVEISDIELKREGRSYTCDTVKVLRERFPEDELVLVVGTDMLLSFDEWRSFEYLLKECRIAALTRDDGDDESMAAKKRELESRYVSDILLIAHTPKPMSSEDIRQRLQNRQGADMLADGVYSLIIKNRYYGARPALDWLRKKSYEMLDAGRVAHVMGCEREALALARRWGADEESAATAAILHDCTKRLSYDKQLILCEKYGIILDNVEKVSPQLLHAKTGAALARDMFGVSDEIYGAILWHTTGRPGMSLLEKIIYLADYIEPTRDFPGVDTLRELAYTDLDRAMAKGLSMSAQDIRARNTEPHIYSIDALRYYDRRS